MIQLPKVLLKTVTMGKDPQSWNTSQFRDERVENFCKRVILALRYKYPREVKLALRALKQKKYAVETNTRDSRRVITARFRDYGDGSGAYYSSPVDTANPYLHTFIELEFNKTLGICVAYIAGDCYSRGSHFNYVIFNNKMCELNRKDLTLWEHYVPQDWERRWDARVEKNRLESDDNYWKEQYERRMKNQPSITFSKMFDYYCENNPYINFSEEL